MGSSAWACRMPLDGAAHPFLHHIRPRGRIADRQTDQCIYYEEGPRYCSAERLAVGGGSSAGDACEQKKAEPSEKGSCKWSQNGSGAIPTPQQGLSRIQS